MSHRKLDFFVVGAQKCATSWLYYCLKEHPEISLPDHKLEPGYIGGKLFLEQGEDWFFDRFSDSDSSNCRGDVSVDYLYDVAAAPACIPYSNSDTKFIASLRHPVSRAISSYFWYMRKSRLPLQEPNKGLEPLLNSRPGFPDALDGFYEHIARRGCYAKQLENYLQNFDASQVIVVAYETLKAENRTSLQAIYRHLGVDDSFVPASLYARTKKNSYNPFLLRFERLGSSKVIARLSNYANQLFGLLGLARSPAISPDVMNRLHELYEPEIERTRDVLARLPVGQRPSDEMLKVLWAERVTYS